MECLPTVRFRMIPVVQLNEKSILPNVSRNTLELESLKSRPAQKCIVCRSEFPKVPRNILIRVTVGHGTRRNLAHLGSGVLTDNFV